MRYGHHAGRVALGLCAFLIAATAYADSKQQRQRVDAATEKLDTWLGNSSYGKGWREFLALEDLKRQLRAAASDEQAAAIERTWGALSSGAPGLERPQFAAMRKALSSWWPEVVYPEGTDLAKAAAGSRRFAAPDKRAIAWTKSELQAALARLEDFLARTGRNGAGWRKFLEVDDLRRQLRSDAPDLEVLDRISQRFTSDNVGLEMPVFAQVGERLRNYIDAVELAKMPDFEQQHAAEMKALSESLSRHTARPNEEDAAAIGRSLGWLNRSRQSSPLVEAVHRRYSVPNLHVRMAEPIVVAGIEQPINDRRPITDVILGTDIEGTAHTVGRIDADLVPSSERAIIDTLLYGTTRTNTVGYNGPATIYAEGATALAGRKRIFIDSDGFKSYPAAAAANTSTSIQGVSAGGGGLFGRMIQKIATKKVYQSKGTAEQIAARHAEERVEDRMEREAQAGLWRAHNGFSTRFRNPLVRRGEFPKLMQFRTTDDDLRIVARQANVSQIAAASPPPEPRERGEMAVQAHESFINNLASGLLAGITWHEEQVQAKVIELRGSLPDELKTEEDRDPWSITFASERPVTVVIDDGGFTITIRGQRFTSGERTFRAMNISANYKVEKQGDGSRLVRQGDLKVLPPGFVEGRDKMPPDQVSLRRLLQRRFGKLLKPEAASEGLELPGKWSKLGRLRLVELVADDGWAVLAWNRKGTAGRTAKLSQLSIRK